MAERGMTDLVKVKSKEGHEAFVLGESVPAYEAAGWKALKDQSPVDPSTQGEPQPLSPAPQGAPPSP